MNAHYSVSINICNKNKNIKPKDEKNKQTLPRVTCWTALSDMP